MNFKLSNGVIYAEDSSLRSENWVNTGHTIATDEDGAFLVSPEGEAGEGRHETTFDALCAFRFIFAN